jgi:energy-coupling factor transporter transmembrane protein EcfT
MISRQSVPVVIALLSALFFLTLVNIFKPMAVWLYALMMLSIFTGLVLAIRGRAKDPKSFWISLFVSLAIILGVGILIGLMGYVNLASP